VRLNKLNRATSEDKENGETEEMKTDE